LIGNHYFAAWRPAALPSRSARVVGVEITRSGPERPETRPFVGWTKYWSPRKGQRINALRTAQVPPKGVDKQNQKTQAVTCTAISRRSSTTPS